MKVKVRLFGTLGQQFPGYDPAKALEVEIPDGARVKDLLAHLGIPEVKGGVAAVEGLLEAWSLWTEKFFTWKIP